MTFNCILFYFAGAAAPDLLVQKPLGPVFLGRNFNILQIFGFLHGVSYLSKF